MSRSTTSLLTMAALLAAGLGLSACNTVAGAGKDASAVGHDVSRGANASGNYINDKTGASKN